MEFNLANMNNYTLYYLTLIILNLLTQPTALAECCSQHGGICNKEKCCDDTPLPTDCGDIRLIKLPPLASLTLPQDQPKPNKDQPEKPSEPQMTPQSRLYSWYDQQTDRRYLSSTFPPWYRHPQYLGNYPTVLVYDENHRLIDNTQRKNSPDIDQAIRKQVEQDQKQLAAYQKIQEQEQESQSQQTHLATLLEQWAQQEQQWMETQQVTPPMTRLLAELAKAKTVVIAMTEEQVKQAWGEPDSENVALIDNQQIKTWIYPHGKQVTLQAGRVQEIKQ